MALALPPLAAGQGFEEAYQLMVLIDSREKREINQLKASLQAQGMAAEARNLPVGDVLWVARAR
jgi:ERCC4-type nuclease